MTAYGHKGYSVGREGTLCARTKGGDWESSDTLNLVDAYLQDLKRDGEAVDNPTIRLGYYKICKPLDGYIDADFDEYNRHLDAIVPTSGIGAA